MAKLSELKAQAETLAAAGRHDQALRIYDHVLQHLEGTEAIGREFPLYVKAGDAHVALGQVHEAVERYRAAAARYAAVGAADEIVELCGKIEAADSSQRTVHFVLAGLLLDHGHAEPARAVLADFARRTERHKMLQGLEQLAGRPAEQVTGVLRKAIDTGLGRATAPQAAAAATPPPSPPVDEPHEEPAPPPAPEEPSAMEGTAVDEEAPADVEEPVVETAIGGGNGLVLLGDADDLGGVQTSEAVEEPQLESVEDEERAASGFVIEHGSQEPPHEAPEDQEPEAPVQEEAEPEEQVILQESVSEVPERAPARRESESRRPAPWDRAPEPRIVMRDDQPRPSPKRRWVLPVVALVIVVAGGAALVMTGVIPLGGDGVATGADVVTTPPTTLPTSDPAPALPDSVTGDSVSAAASSLQSIDTLGASEASAPGTGAEIQPTGTPEAPGAAPEPLSGSDTASGEDLPPDTAPSEATPPTTAPTPPVSRSEIVAIGDLDILRATQTATGWDVVQILETGDTVMVAMRPGSPTAVDSVLSVSTDVDGNTMGTADYSGFRVTVRGLIDADQMWAVLGRLIMRPRP